MDLGAWASCPHLSSIPVHLHFEPPARPLESSAGFGCPPCLRQMLFGIERSRKLPSNDGQVIPKVIQMAFGRLLETYGIYGVGATLGHLWRDRELLVLLFVF
jgi:hypothetical protein